MPDDFGEKPAVSEEDHPHTFGPGPKNTEPRRPQDILRWNIKAYRMLRQYSQGEMADRMTALGHEWNSASVGFVERGRRAISTDELIGVALGLGVGIDKLLDPTGPDGLSPGPMIYGASEPMLAEVASAWLQGEVTIQIWNVRPLTFRVGNTPRSSTPRREDRYTEDSTLAAALYQNPDG